MNKKWSVGLPLMAFALLAIYVLAVPGPKLPLDAANGVYANDCCGTIVLRDGVMSFGNQELTYVIEKDKQGAYILPQRYVGIYPGQGLQIERSRNVLKLSLDDEEHPQTITILGSDGVYLFTR